MDDVNKKLIIRKVLKEVVFKTFAECNTATEEEKLKSACVTLKRKINTETIEDEIIDISNYEKFIEDIIIESNEFEIKTKSKLATMEKLVRKQQPDVKYTGRNENLSMRLLKLEIPKFVEMLKSGIHLGFIQSCNRQTKSTGRRKIQLFKNISDW